MNPHLLAALGRERRRALEEDFARGDVLGNGLRTLIARALRATGEALFRLGMALEKTTAADQETGVIPSTSSLLSTGSGEG